MKLDPQLLDLIACPESREKLTPAPQDLIDALNASIGAGKLKNRAGRPLTEALDGGLIRPDGRYMYPIRAGIPNLLVDEAIGLGDHQS